MAAELERLVALYVSMLDLQDRANAEAYAGDDARTAGHLITAEQHYASSHNYRQRAAEKTQEVAQLLLGLKLLHDEATVADLNGRAKAEARRRLYGSAELGGRPFLE
jgi:hypothetical protein